MKNYINKIICVQLFLVICKSLYSQNPVCPSNLIYINVYNKIVALDPNQPLSATNPYSITIIPSNLGSGIALMPNINGGTLSPTFYTAINGNYYYWDGANWVNTGHSTGTLGAVNMGGCGSAIYNLTGTTPLSVIYSYSGTANGTSLCTTPYGCVADIAVDCDCNFYIFNASSATGQALIKYSPAGVIQTTFALNGIPPATGGGGFAIVGDKVYYMQGVQFYTGQLGGPVINFTSSVIPASNPINAADWASCPFAGIIGIAASTPTVCAGGSVALTATGASSFTWTPPASGSVNIVYPTNGTNSYTVTTGSGTATCLSQAAITISAVPLPTVNATVSPLNICPGQTVQLLASGANLYSWQPLGTGQSFTTTANANTIFTVTGTDPNNCSAQKTVQVNVDLGPSIAVSGYTLYCSGSIISLMASGASTYSWNGTAGAGTNTFMAIANGTINVTGKNSQTGCVGSTYFPYSVVSCAGIDEGNQIGVTKVFPNPAKEIIQFENLRSVYCKLYDSRGTFIQIIQIDEEGRADISQLPLGLYFLRFDEPHTFLIKMVKE